MVGANQQIARPGWRESASSKNFASPTLSTNAQRCWELWDLLLYDKVVSEPNITLLLETILYSASAKNGRIVTAEGRCDKRSISTVSARNIIAIAPAIRGLTWKPARKCGPDARRAPGMVNRSCRRSPTTATLGPSILCTVEASPAADAVHGSRVGSQSDQAGPAVPAHEILGIRRQPQPFEAWYRALMVA